jgi:hypothetical protein
VAAGRVAATARPGAEHLSTLIGLLGDGAGRKPQAAKARARETLRAALDQIRSQVEAATAPGSDR